MNNITLKHLRYFSAVARHQHFGLAAEASSISQPAISFQIKELEQILGHSLFERYARHIKLTPFGQAFLQNTQPILKSIDDLSDLPRAWHDTMSGALKLGLIPTVAPYILPSIMEHMNHSLPDVDLHIKEAQTEKLLHDLHQGHLDLCIVALPIHDPSLVEIPILTESFVLVRPEHDRGTPIPNPKDLQDMQLLLLEEGHCLRDQALSFCKIDHMKTHNTMEGSSLTTLVQMVAGGLGLTLLPQMAIRIETASTTVCVEEFPSPKPSRVIGIIHRKHTPLIQHYTQIAGIIQCAVSSEPKEQQ